MSLDQHLVSLFRDEVSKRFAFLVKEHSFSGPILEIEDGGYSTNLTYLGRNLALEFELERRHFNDVACTVVRVIDGKKAPYEWREDLRSQNRQYLVLLLSRRKLREPFRKVGHLTPEQQIPAILEDYAQKLKEYGQDILADSPAVLDPPSSPPRKAPTDPSRLPE
jgi:hypothetical protein